MRRMQGASRLCHDRDRVVPRERTDPSHIAFEVLSQDAGGDNTESLRAVVADELIGPVRAQGALDLGMLEQVAVLAESLVVFALIELQRVLALPAIGVFDDGRAHRILAPSEGSTALDREPAEGLLLELPGHGFASSSSKGSRPSGRRRTGRVG